MAYAPPCSNQSKSSGHRVAHNAVRGFEAPGRAGEGHGRQDEPPIDCCVVVIFRIISRDPLKSILYTLPPLN